MNRKTILDKFPLKPPEKRQGTMYRRWLESQNDLHLMALEAISDAVLFMAPDGTMTFINRAAEALLGRSRSELTGMNLLKLFRTVEGESLADEIMDRVKVLSEFHCSLAYIRPVRGSLIPVEIHVASLKFEGEIVRIMATCHDLRQMLAHRAELEVQAHTDQLTGCKNRWWFDEEYPKMELWARASKGWLGLLFVDLDHFKRFNDESYVLGDELIKLAADTIRSVLRPNDNLVRLGGDEFVLALQGVDRLDCQDIANRILAALAALDIRMPRRPGERFPLTASIGISVLRGSDARLAELLLYAQEGKRLAKENGRNRIYVLPEETPAEESRPSLH